jgi:hypothetical protein
MTNNIHEFKNKICGIESIEISNNNYQLIHDDNYYNESHTKEELILFLKEIENFIKNIDK